MTTARLRRKRAQEIARRYAQPGVNVVDEFLQEKRVEAARENNVSSDTAKASKS